MQHLMDTTTAANFALAMEPDFNTDVKQILQGFPLGPVMPPAGAAPHLTATSAPSLLGGMVSLSEAATPTTSHDTSSSAAVNITPAPVTVTATTASADACPGVSNNSNAMTILDSVSLATGPASRRRGLDYARHVKACAREEFKEKRRLELEACGEGDRTKRRKKNDTSMNEKQKYRRRLQKNQDSAAAARYAQEAYLKNLEMQANSFDSEMCALEQKKRRSDAEKDEYARLNTVLLDHTRSLEAELQRLREIIALASNNNNKNKSATTTTATDVNNNFGYAFDEIVNNNNPQFINNNNNTSLENKALFEEYSAPAFSYPNSVSKTHKITPAF